MYNQIHTITAFVGCQEGSKQACVIHENTLVPATSSGPLTRADHYISEIAPAQGRRLGSFHAAVW